MTILDFDDFCDENNGLDLLYRLKAAVPSLKVNLFTIPGRCTNNFLSEVCKLHWVDMIPHGFVHKTSRECQNWTYAESIDYLDWVEDFGFTRGYKSPGWQTSDGLFQALAERNYWVADQAYNNNRRPPELRAYILDAPYKIHGHIGHWGSGHNANALELIYDTLCKLHGEFKFIKDIV